jgi:CitMHS family citrate-Mg2+:H+ or citrate-Ca2+:H+ symporter
MLTLLGLGAIVALLGLILFRVTSVVAALTLVPLVAALAGGFAGELGAFALDGIRSVSPTAALLAFAVVYFGLMNDAGLFQPIIQNVVRIVGNDPLKVVVGTAAIATVAHLDGAGASTFMVTVPAMLPIYKRLRMDPLTLTCATAMAAGTMNILPWGGPTTRAATALQVGVADLFNPLIPATAAGIVAVFIFAVVLGSAERRRVAARLSTGDHSVVAMGADLGEPQTPQYSSMLMWLFNALLTAFTLVALFTEIVPIAVVFLVATAIALVVNYPNAGEQRERLTRHGSAAMVMVTTVFAAGLFMGIMTKSGMLTAMARDLVAILPASVLSHFPILLAVASMPLSLVFDPDSFYFGVLPIFANASLAAGGSVVEVGRAALLGQMTTGFPVSPLTPATFLLVGLADVDLADHQRRTIPYLFGITLVMTIMAVATGALTW